MGGEKKACVCLSAIHFSLLPEQKKVLFATNFFSKDSLNFRLESQGSFAKRVGTHRKSNSVSRVFFEGKQFQIFR